MGVITISTESRAGGRRVGRDLAERLGLEYLDKEIIHRIALAINVPREEVEEFEEESHSRFRSLLSNLFDLDALKGEVRSSPSEIARDSYDDRDKIPFEFAVNGWIDSDIYRQMILKTVTALGQKGDVVLVGRGGQAILHDLPGAVHIRFVANLEDRARWVARDLGLPEEEARARLENADERSRSYLRFYFDFDPDTATYYHLVFNTSRVKRARCAALVEDLMRRHA